MVGYIEQTLDAPVAPAAEQQVVIERRVAELKEDPGLALSKDEAVTATRTLLP